MKGLLVVSALLSITVISCNYVKDKTKEGLHKAGEAGGEAIKQVSQGVSDAFEVTVTVSDSLKKQGVELGKASFSSDSTGTDNVLTVYVMFHKKIAKDVMIKIADGQNTEKGRAGVKLEGDENFAKYIDIHFDRHVNIDAVDKVTIE